jgi:hypothetical protein
MWEYNNDTTLDAINLLRDPNNELLLRADLHKAFDRKFSLFPQNGLLYHNTRVTISQREVNYIFARFAWSIFPSLTVFLTSTQKSRLVIQWGEASDDWIESEVSGLSRAQRSTASRSNSPTKRSRMASSIGDHLDDNCASEVRGRKRNIDTRPAYDSTPRQVKNRRLSSGNTSLSPTSLGEPAAPFMTEDVCRPIGKLRVPALRSFSNVTILGKALHKVSGLDNNVARQLTRSQPDLFPFSYLLVLAPQASIFT